MIDNYQKFTEKIRAPYFFLSKEGKIERQLEDNVEYCVKNNKWKVSAIFDEDRRMTVLYACVIYDRPDLMEKMINLIPTELRKEILNSNFIVNRHSDMDLLSGDVHDSHEGRTTDNDSYDSYDVMFLMELAKSNKMKFLLSKYLDIEIAKKFFSNKDTFAVYKELNK